MATTELSKARAALQAERDRLRTDLADLGLGDDGGLEYDPNFADTSQVTAERGEAEALSGELLEALADVDAALARIDAGSYGTCSSCGQPIGDDRLEAMPTARLCMACASKA